MEAGRELDVLVAEKVMGVYPLRLRVTGELVSPPPRYSTDIAAAWAVVERIGGEGFYIKHVGPTEPGDREVWRVSFRNDLPISYSETVPQAICLAALAAAGAEVPV